MLSKCTPRYLSYTKILENPAVVLQIGEEIEEMMNQTDGSCDPHVRLEFLKVAI